MIVLRRFIKECEKKVQESELMSVPSINPSFSALLNTADAEAIIAAKSVCSNIAGIQQIPKQRTVIPKRKGGKRARKMFKRGATEKKNAKVITTTTSMRNVAPGEDSIIQADSRFGDYDLMSQID